MSTEHTLTQLVDNKWDVAATYVAPTVNKKASFLVKAETRFWEPHYLDDFESASIEVSYDDIQRTPEVFNLVLQTFLQIKGTPYLPELKLQLRAEVIPPVATHDPYYGLAAEAIRRGWYWAENATPNSYEAFQYRKLQLAKWEWQGIRLDNSVGFYRNIKVGENPTSAMEELMERAYSAEETYVDYVPQFMGDGSVRVNEQSTKLLLNSI